MQAFTQGLSLFALKLDEAMRDVILVEEIVELMSFAGHRARREPAYRRIPDLVAAGGVA